MLVLGINLNRLSLSWLLIVSLVSGSRIEYGEAQWGLEAPDYSMVKAPKETSIYIRTILFVDDKVTAHYDFDMLRVKENVRQVVEEANKYLNQLGIGIIVLDILQTSRHDLSLENFSSWKAARKTKLPDHDFATLMSYRYGGGLAYVGGMCSNQAVSLCGFYPREPRAMGSIFFHEIAHLIGIPHKAKNESIYIPNCGCPPGTSDPVSGCLRIPGFDHDCTVQEFVNIIYKNKCLMSKPVFERSEPICGNGVVEAGEECDCGLAQRCDTYANCYPHTCKFKVPIPLVYFGLFTLAVVSVSLFFLAIYLSVIPKMLSCFKKIKHRQSKSNPYTDGQITNLTASPYRPRKYSNIYNNASMIVVNESQCRTLTRPNKPPPPPPVRMTLHVDSNSTYLEPRSSVEKQQERYSWRYDDFSDDDFDDEVREEVDDKLSSYPLPPGIGTCPSYPNNAPINRVTVNQQHPSDSQNQSSTGSTTPSDAQYYDNTTTTTSCSS